jgi:hypothetical protein
MDTHQQRQKGTDGYGDEGEDEVEKPDRVVVGAE